MKSVNYLLDAFGFKNLQDLSDSSFGHLLSEKAISISVLFGVFKTVVEDGLGFNLAVFGAFVFLNILEYITGLKASRKRGEDRESRKMGRMFFKVGIYLAITWMLHSFMEGLKFPEIMDFEVNPFVVLYWTFLAGVIYQLIVSLGENLKDLGYEEMNGFLGAITRIFSKYFINNEDSNSTE